MGNTDFFLGSLIRNSLNSDQHGCGGSSHCRSPGTSLMGTADSKLFFSWLASFCWMTLFLLITYSTMLQPTGHTACSSRERLRADDGCQQTDNWRKLSHQRLRKKKSRDSQGCKGRKDYFSRQVGGEGRGGEEQTPY